MGKASNPLRPAGQRQGLDTVWEWNLGPRAESGMIWVWPQVLSRHSIFPHAKQELVWEKSSEVDREGDHSGDGPVRTNGEVGVPWSYREACPTMPKGAVALAGDNRALWAVFHGGREGTRGAAPFHVLYHASLPSWPYAQVFIYCLYSSNKDKSTIWRA